MADPGFDIRGAWTLSTGGGVGNRPLGGGRRVRPPGSASALCHSFKRRSKSTVIENEQERVSPLSQMQTLMDIFGHQP